MKVREFLILDALNIASAQHWRKDIGYNATAADIAGVLLWDTRLQHDYPDRMLKMSALQVGAHLKRMSSGRRRPLVEKVNTRRWRLAEAGLEVLVA